MSRHIAETALAYMRREGHKSLCWGDGALCEIGHEAGIKLRRPHPINMIQRVADALARCPDLFETFRIHGCDTRGRSRVVRAFRPVQPLTAPEPMPSPRSDTLQEPP